ncbi:hypothetical protein LCGC14_1993270 [marine sediment metagenome]|uniref:Uncharacterized protein n=1 Tax=marine sediment metagenome TaxID=412755 RepID=A0A0F9HIT4_9ZZZZ
MGYLHEFTCDKCGKQEHNDTGDSPFFWTNTGQTRALLCRECKDRYDDLVEANKAALAADLDAFLHVTPVPEETGE